MKNCRCQTFLLALALFLTPIGPFTANANPPDRMTYQGYLIDANGIELGKDDPKNFEATFRIWDAPTGGTVKWAERQTITVADGYFSVVLGEGSSVGEARPALADVFKGTGASDRYMGISVKDPEASGDAVEIAPRLRLVTTPFAFTAHRAVSLVNQTTGDTVLTTSGSSVGINTENPQSPLDVNGRMTSTELRVNGAAEVNSLNVAGTLSANNISTPSLTVNGTLAANSLAGHGTIPIGGIIMWSGPINAIPPGWALCDGATVNGHVTPNLRDRFIVSVGSAYGVGFVGGQDFVTLTVDQMPSHTHTAETAKAGLHGHTLNVHFREGGGWNRGALQETDRGVDGTDQSLPAGDHIHNVTVHATGGGQPHENRPAYYALAFIMRVQ